MKWTPPAQGGMEILALRDLRREEQHGAGGRSVGSTT